MKISLTNIADYASRTIDFLDEQQISSTVKMEKMFGRELRIQNNNNHFLSFALRPSNASSFAYTMSYIITGVGVPLEVKLNPMLRYTQLFVKSSENIPEYARFGNDVFGNIIQNRLLETCDLQSAREELQRLVALKEKKNQSNMR